MKQWSGLQAVIIGGSIAAALDILFAISFAAYNGLPPARLLQTVASGLLGNAAFSGGNPTAALGLALHFVMSYLWATLFLTFARFATATIHRPMLTALLFGIVVLLTMRLVVLPLSAFPRPVTFRPFANFMDLMSHVFFFAAPIVFAVRKALVRT
ncbi:MAG: hypothetical protein WC213_10670 [Arenimonas sp.]|jgi:uncharacterized membrane protein YagU involved in acid resistance